MESMTREKTTRVMLPTPDEIRRARETMARALDKDVGDNRHEGSLRYGYIANIAMVMLDELAIARDIAMSCPRESGPWSSDEVVKYNELADKILDRIFG